eukprot:366101-Chlamydomonas_euryale.AAC.16
MKSRLARCSRTTYSPATNTGRRSSRRQRDFFRAWGMHVMRGYAWGVQRSAQTHTILSSLRPCA